MYCARCGAPLATDARFCVNCGAPVAAPPPHVPATPDPMGEASPTPAWAMGTAAASRYAPPAGSDDAPAQAHASPGYSGEAVPPMVPAAPTPHAPYAAAPPAAVLRYAGFWRRFWAVCIDGLLLSFVLMPLRLGLRLGAWGGWGGWGDFERGDMNLDRLVPLFMGSLAFIGVKTVAEALYFALMHSSIKQATIGQMVLGIRVTDLLGRRISASRALGRYFAAWLSSLTLLVGYIIGAFTERKQTLHDMIVGTLVVRSER